MREFDFIVIGGGLAGLAAQHQLVKKGYQVLLLEKSDRVGGRTKSVDLLGSKADVGTQFFHQDYVRIMRLIVELGLERSVVGPKLEFLHEKSSFLIHSKNPISPWLQGMLSFREQMTFMKGAVKFSGSHPEDVTDALLYDHLSARELAVSLLGETVSDKVIEPYFSAFTYAHGRELSGAMLVRALKYMVSRKHPVGLKDGLAALPMAMARGKEIIYGIEIQKINGTSVVTNKGDYRARKIICATTSTVAKKLLGNSFPTELITEYSPSLHHALLTKRGKSVTSCYATMVGETADVFYNVATRERFKAQGLVKDEHELYGLLASKAGAINHAPANLKLLNITEEDVIARESTNWSEAIPILPPGKMKTIMNYRSSLNSTQTLFLAGDYLGSHCAEGAVESGEFVASLFPVI